MTIRSTDEGIAVKKSLEVSKVDPVIPQVAFALFRISSEFTNAREQRLEISFSHGGDVTDCIYKRMIPASRLRVLALRQMALLQF